MDDANSTNEACISAKIIALPTAARERVRQLPGRHPKGPSMLEDARSRREKKARVTSAMEIRLFPGDDFEYAIDENLSLAETIKGAIACYVVMGDFLERLKDAGLDREAFWSRS
ncbi:hypothetical protein [Ralstonia sp. UBA689]|uniref:hypothetical protein n=1 Tax=Ralstonia sp. UBA689 TaxID=1947373 RepID=UPI0025EEEA86|nr:hypothetical protein [Ralstonia sp. UBA689]